MSSSFFNKLAYKKKRVGIVEKNGKSYVKYAKTPRFKISTNAKCVILSLVTLTVLALGLRILITERAAREQAEEETIDEG